MYSWEEFFAPCVSMPDKKPYDQSSLLVGYLRVIGDSDLSSLVLVSDMMANTFNKINKSFRFGVRYQIEKLSNVDKKVFLYLQQTLEPHPFIDGVYCADTDSVLFVINVLVSEAQKRIVAIENKAQKASEATKVINKPVELHSPEKAIKNTAPDSGYVYLLKMVNGSFWKIGRTSNPDNRLKTFNVKLPFDVEFDHLIKTENMYYLESMLHTRFSKQRAGGEWFNLSQDDVDYIKSL